MAPITPATLRHVHAAVTGLRTYSGEPASGRIEAEASPTAPDTRQTMTPGANRERHTVSALQDKIALVTGASSGLGAKTARLLAREGATVFGIARDADGLAEVFADINDGAYASVDVVSAQACTGAVEQCVAQFGGLDVL